MLKNEDMGTSFGRRLGKLRKHAGNDAVASFTQEGKGVVKSDIDLPGERFAQLAARPEEPGSDRRFRNSEDGGRFLDGQLFHPAQHEDRAVLLRKLIDLLLQHAP